MKARKYIIPIIISFLLFAVFLVIGSHKTYYHIDEVYTLGSTNSITETTNSPIIKAETLYDGQELVNDYIVFPKGEPLNFGRVCRKQSADVHPPLYYLFIHLSSFLFAGRFTNLSGLLPNALFAVIVFWQTAAILYKLCHKKLAFLLAFFLIFTTGILNTVVFFRMYMLLTLCTNALLLLLLNYVPWGKIPFKFYPALFLAVIGGTMTHYYYTVLCAIACAIYALYLLVYRQYRPLLFFVLTGLCAVATSIALYPAMLEHIFVGVRGKQAFDALLESSLLSTLKAYAGFICKRLFGLIGTMALPLIVILLIKDKFAIFSDRTFLFQTILISCSAIGYILVISKIAPYHDTDRYIVNVYSLLFALVYGIAILLADKFHPRLRWLVLFFALAATCFSYTEDIAYLHPDEPTQKTTAMQTYSEAPCLYLYEGSGRWKISATLMDLRWFNTLVFENEQTLENGLLQEYETCDAIFVCIDKGYDIPATLQHLLNESPNLDDWHHIYTSHYTEFYYLE